MRTLEYLKALRQAGVAPISHSMADVTSMRTNIRKALAYDPDTIVDALANVVYAHADEDDARELRASKELCRRLGGAIAMVSMDEEDKKWDTPFSFSSSPARPQSTTPRIRE